MKNLIPLPNKVYFSSDEKFKAALVIEPLYPGFGVTIGNALRRVLLSSLPGAAVTAVKIKGVDHEFSTLANVTEDIVDIILNLKQLRLRLSAEEPVRLALSAKGQKQVTAADIKSDPRIEIINPDLVIAQLDTKSADLAMEIVVEQGRGYVPVEQREGEKLEIGMIAIDAIFTPMRTVNFEVQNVRVGQITNYDKLTISMETDGTITGREALDIAAQILVDHFALLRTVEMPAESAALSEALVAGGDVAEEDLKNLGLPTRAYNALLRNNVKTISQLKGLTRQDFEAMEGLGEKSIDEILAIISRQNASPQE